MKSIITDDMNECYICHSTQNIEIHHIFGGVNRSNSTIYGLVIPLCHRCHNEPPYGVHFNKEMADELKALGQAKFEQRFADIDFKEVFGRNYL